MRREQAEVEGGVDVKPPKQKQCLPVARKLTKSEVLENAGIEPATSCMLSTRSTN
jgi:hypothetical protein